jgi:phage shock protein PspC (stress-responsive transcriptional regulator)
VTSNHRQHQHTRPAGALLAGVCAGLAERLGWNAWAIRGLFVLGLLIETIGTGVVYVILAVLLPRFGGTGSSSSASEGGDSVLRSESLSERNERIADLERRFREMEDGP